MDAAEMSPRLPGTSPRGLALGGAIALGIFLLLFAALTIPAFTPIGGEGGHLPWPIVQWTVTSPIGAFVLVAVGTLIMAPPLVLLQPRMLHGYYLARAVDVTGVPVENWSRRTRGEARLTWVERWLGHGRRQQRRSVALLVLAVLVAAGLMAAFIAFHNYSFSAIGRVSCCPPDYHYQVTGIAFMSESAALGLYFFALYRWFRRVEVSCGISIRYLSSLWTAPFYYVRRPGVTPEAVAEALARIVPHGRVPLAQTILVFVLALTPLVLLLSGSIFLGAWLQLQWIPG
jgi:hypothetical protein